MLMTPLFSSVLFGCVEEESGKLLFVQFIELEEITRSLGSRLIYMTLTTKCLVKAKVSSIDAHAHASS